MTDPLDKQLVEAVLSRPRRAQADVEAAKLAGLPPARLAAVAADPDVAVDAKAPGAPADEIDMDVVDAELDAAAGVEAAVVPDVDGGRLASVPEPAKLDAAELEEPTPEELDALSADMIGIDDPVRMYLKEIGKVALLTAEEEVVLAKAIELGEQMAEEPWKALVALHQWTLHDTERKTRTQKPQHRLPFADESHRLVHRGLSSELATEWLVADSKNAFQSCVANRCKFRMELMTIVSMAA